MSRIVLVLLVVLAAFSASSFGQQCGLNEEFRSCGSPCEPTCAVPVADFCTYNCKIGCQCKTGYLRNGGGTCVLPDNC
ncbi:chymotrypsin inhibitor-like [Ptiloglossa arizonensis]|uniref:chymotrypsin inhibitor-like n=1 Tax=Ptiloglossa arizonensis TaxID=3350558 RepID=UPI003FA18DA3